MSTENGDWVKLPPDPKIYPLIRSEVEEKLYQDYCNQQSETPKNDEWIKGQLMQSLYINWYKKQYSVDPPSIYGPPKK
ncbi:MAG TPA: hypothetical protein VIK86_04415 [Candidatus Paceibacterota bacterium]